MDHRRADQHAVSEGFRSLAEILADARDLQANHAPRLFAAAASWMRNRFVPRAGEPERLAARRLVIH